MTPAERGWVLIGESSNARFYEVDPSLLVVVPHEGAVDTAETARESIRIQLEHLRRLDRRAGVVVLVDPVADQDAGARRVYREAPDPSRQACFALVAKSRFGRAVSSIFMGLSPPRCPTRMFGDFDAAVAWARSMVEPR